VPFKQEEELCLDGHAINMEVLFWRSGREVLLYGYTAGGKRISTENQYVASYRSEAPSSMQPSLQHKRQRMLFA
jgi:hypothetical protein